MEVHLAESSSVQESSAATAVRTSVTTNQEIDMSQIDAEISLLDARIKELRVQRATMHRSYDGHKAPTRMDLPTETLGEIFLYCLPNSEPVSVHDTPLLLMRVCRRWRQIAEGTPRLWTELDLGHELALDPLYIIPIWIRNSGALPINVTMHPSSWPTRWHQRESARLIVENFHRFGHFSGELDIYLHQELNRLERPIHAPLLESFDLWFTDSDDSIPISSLNGCIRAPKLSTISLELPFMMDLMTFHPMSLRSVTLRHGLSWMPSSAPSLGFLSTCRNVSFLNIHANEALNPHNSPVLSPILLPSVETLIINLWPEYDSSPILNAIVAPSLLDLVLDPQDDLDEESSSPLTGALDALLGHNPPLQRLSITGLSDMDPDRFVPLLTRLRDLQCLSLEHCTIDNAVIQALTPDPSVQPSSWVCPRLSILNIMGADLSRDRFLELVRRRAPVPGKETLGAVYLRQLDARHTSNRHRHNKCYVTALKEIALQCGGLLEIKC